MVQNCAVVGCSNKRDKETTHLGFHKFPFSDPERLQKWIHLVSRKDAHGKLWFPSKSARICSDHFLLEDYELDTQNKVLRATAVPSKFPCRPGQSPGQSQRVRKPSWRSKRPFSNVEIACSSSTEAPDHELDPQKKVPGTTAETSKFPCHPAQKQSAKKSQKKSEIEFPFTNVKVEVSRSAETPEDELDTQEEVLGINTTPSPFPYHPAQMKQSVQKKTPTSKNNGCFNNVEASSSPEAPDDELNAQEEVPGKTLVPSPFPFSHHTPAQKQSIVQKASWKSENEHLVNKVEACSGSEAPDDELNTQGEIPGKTLVPSPFSFPYQEQSVQKRPWKSENEYLVNKVEACSGSEGSDDECITQEEEVQGKTLVRSELSCHPAQIELVQKTPGRPKKTCPCPSAQKEFVEKAPGKPKKKRPFNIVVVEPNGSTESSDSDDELDMKEKMSEKTAAASQLPPCHSAQKEFVRETPRKFQSKLPVNVFVVEARSSSEEASEGEHDAQKKVPEKTDTVLLQAPCLPAQQQSAEKTQRKRSRKKRRFDNGESSSNVEALDEETANLFSEHSYFRPPKGLELNLMEVMVALERSKAKVKSHSRTIKCLRQRLMRRDTTIASMTEELESLRKRLSPDEQNPVK